MRKFLLAGFASGTLLIMGTGIAGAAPFLCPIVGEGTTTAPGLQGTAATSAISPPAGPSVLPGQNQAGAHANPNAYNEIGGPIPGNVPGAPGYTPIWNP